NVLKRMNRWYTATEYLRLISKIKNQISNIKFTTDIIVGFCGETEKEFQNTVKLAKKVCFEKAYLAMYSSRFGTTATKVFKDDIPHHVKEKRWLILENLINKPHLKKHN
ncbi:MAG: tRNA (N6-isopentenyl adenosine(37)-C2)-methylthiotransferase MiaB, partial [Candidatus Roizmanbacteria bacterium]